MRESDVARAYAVTRSPLRFRRPCGSFALAALAGVAALVLSLCSAIDAKPASPTQLREWTGLLRDEDPGKRAVAASLLLAEGTDKTLQVLLDALKPGEPEATRVTVIDVFGIKGDERATPQMIVALADPSEAVRTAAASALQKIDSPMALMLMRKAAGNAERPIQTRVQLIAILGEMRAIDAVSTLIDLLSDDDESLRNAARASIERITLQSFETVAEWRAWWEQRRNLRREQILEEFVELQSKRLRNMRRIVEKLYLKLLAQPDAQKDVELLIDALFNSDSPKVKLTAIKALSDLKGKPVAGALIRALEDADGTVRRDAARALGGQADAAPEATPALLKALNDAMPPVRAAAADSLGSLKAVASLDALGERLADPSTEVAVAAANALGEIADPRAVPLLDRTASVPERTPELGEACARALARIKDPAVGPILVRLLKSPEDKVRWVAVDALGERRAREAVDPISKIALSDKNPQIRQAALAALGNIGDALALAAVVKALSDKEASVAEQAMLSLAQLADGDPKLYAAALDSLIASRRFDKAEQVLARAIEQISRTPNHASEIASLQKRVATGFIKAKDWARARPHLRTLASTWPKEANYSKDLVACLDALKEYDDALEALVQARRNTPNQAAHWWSETVRIVQRLAAAGHAKRVVAGVDKLEKESPGLGGEATAAELRRLRDEARPKPPPTP